MRQTFLVSSIFIFLAMPVSAHADDVPAAKAHFDRGTTFYDLQRYDEAAKEYEAAYEAKHDPALLFNIGQAYRFAGNYQKSIGAFKAYLRHLPDSTNKPEVEARIVEMQKLSEEQKRNQGKPPAGTIAPVEPSKIPEPTESEPSAAKPPPTRLPIASAPSLFERSAGRSMRIAGGTVAALGVAALAAGIAVAVVAQSPYNAINMPIPGYVFNPSIENQLNTDQALEAAFFALGGAAIVTGATLLALGVRASHHARIAFLPAFAPGRASAVVHFTF